jgi:hypothetical protein
MPRPPAVQALGLAGWEAEPRSPPYAIVSRQRCLEARKPQKTILATHRKPRRIRGKPENASAVSFRKEVIQPQVPLRLPCYDLVPIAEFILGAWLPIPKDCGYLSDFGCPPLSWLDGRCVQGSGTHSPRYADPRLLAIPASCRRVAACNPN